MPCFLLAWHHTDFKSRFLFLNACICIFTDMHCWRVHNAFFAWTPQLDQIERGAYIRTFGFLSRCNSVYIHMLSCTLEYLRQQYVTMHTCLHLGKRKSSWWDTKCKRSYWSLQFGENSIPRFDNTDESQMRLQKISMHASARKRYHLNIHHMTYVYSLVRIFLSL